MIYRSILALERLSTGESRHASTAYLKDRRRHERKAYWAGIRRNGKLALRRWRKPLGRYLVLALAVAALGVPALFWLRGPVPSHQKVAIKPILPVTPVASVPAVTSQTVLPAMRPSRPLRYQQPPLPHRQALALRHPHQHPYQRKVPNPFS